MMNYDIQQTLREQRAEQERLRNRRDQNVDQSTSMLSPGTSPSAVTGNLFSQQQSFIPPTPATPGLANTGFSAAAEQRRLENLAASNAANMQNRQADVLGQIPQGNFVGSPDVLQGIVESRTQEVLPENRQTTIGNQTVVGGTSPMFDAAGISNLAAGRGTGTITNPQGPTSIDVASQGLNTLGQGIAGGIAGGAMMGADAISSLAATARPFFDYTPPPPEPTQGAGFGRGQGFEGLDGLYTNRPGFESGPTVSFGGQTMIAKEGFNLGEEGATIGDVLDKITDSDAYEQMLRDQGTPIVTNIVEDIQDPNKESTEESLEDGAGTGKDGPPISTFNNPNLKSLETQIDGLNTGLSVQTSEALTSAYSSGRAAVESAGADTVFLNKFFKQLSQPLQFNENGSPKLPEFPGELLQQLTRNVEREIVNPIYTQYIAEGLEVPSDVPPTITETTPVIDPAGELLLDFYNEYVGNALLMAREAQNQKSQLAIQEAQSNPFGLTAQDQLEIEKLRANPFGLTADQALSLERQGLSADQFIELELEKQRIGARPNLIQAISGFFQPGTVAALGGTQNVEGLLSRLAAFDGAREVLPTVIEQLGGTTQAAPISQNYLQSLVGRVPDDVLSSLETGVPLTSARLAQLERENPTALQIYLGNLAGQGTTQDQAVLESLGRTPGVQNRRASQIGAVVS